VLFNTGNHDENISIYGRGDAIQSWNTDQQKATVNISLPTPPAGLRAPVSVAAIISSSSASVACDFSVSSTIAVPPSLLDIVFLLLVINILVYLIPAGIVRIGQD
jgi:hypothetical protein